MSDAPDAARPVIARGLEGVVLCETKLAEVDGTNGRLTIQGYDIRELAGKATFEEVAYLLWHGHLPTEAEYSIMRREMEAARVLPTCTTDLLKEISTISPGMHALRAAAGTLSVGADNIDSLDVATARIRAERLLAKMPVIVGNYWRYRRGLPPIEVDPSASISETLLHLIQGHKPEQPVIDALDAYLVAVIEHGLNASTFVGRCIISTDSDLVSALTGAIGALKGPKHGGVPGPVLDMLEDIGKPENADPWIRKHLAEGKRVMGFGHRIYKVRDPRAQVLSDAADKLAGESGDRHLHELVKAVEETTVRVLAEIKPGRDLYANVELYAALILHAVGIPSELFTPVFAVGRTVGWTAHMIEQLDDNRLIRPNSLYTGPRGKTFVPRNER